MRDYTFEQLINVEQVRQLLESHHLLSGMPSGFLDNNENVIISVGWQEICTRFHRVHPVCSERCRESNASIKAHLGKAGNNYFEYRCGNGMIDIAMPIFIEGRHLATFFIGQFFYEDEQPDRAFFLAQAGEFGFDPDDYLAALDRTPVLSREHVRNNLMFLYSLVMMLAESGLKSLRLDREMELRTAMANELRELNGALERRVEERTAELTQANRMLSILIPCRRAIMRAEDEQTLLNDMCRIMCDEAGYLFCWAGYAEHDEKRTVRPVAWAGVEDGYLAMHTMTWDDTELGRGPSGSAIRLGEIKYVQDIASDPDFSPWRACAMERGYRSSVALPLKNATATLFGSFNIYSSEADAFSPNEIQLLNELAEDLAFGISVLRMRAERKWLEQILSIKEREYRTLVENLPDLVVRYDTGLRRIYVNPAWEMSSGLSAGEVMNVHAEDIAVVPRPIAPEFSDKLRKAMGTGTSQSIEFSWVNAKGVELYLDFKIVPELDLQGNVVSVLAVGRDITSLKTSERRIAFLDFALNNAHEAAYVIDDSGRFQYVNEESCRALGYTHDELLEMGVSDIDPDFSMEYWIEFHAEVKTLGSRNFERCHRTKDGRLIPVEICTNYFEYDGERYDFTLVRDITERKRMEEQLNQSRKMEAVGQLAGGIAHDFNNIMTAIVGFAHIIGLKLGHDSPLNSYLDKILASAERAASLTRDLLTFSRKEVMQLKPIDLKEAIAGSQQLISRLLREDIELVITLPDVPLAAMAGKIQLTQILMNLTANARDAMPSGGKITITLSSFTMDREYVERHGYGREGKFALITFADNGCGMDEKTREKIFEPFFTTKEVGQGTGLGLATVYGIIRQLGGFINVHSGAGQGAIFRIYIPLIGGAVTAEETAPADVPPPGGSETVLLAEDDPDVREIEESILSEAGYKVISACDGIKALRLFSDLMDSIDLLVLDAVMPGKNGVDVFLQAQKIHPAIRAILVSGYTSEIIAVNELIDQGVRFLHKPVSRRVFLQTVREALDGHAPTVQP